ncbi:hypothetical protein DdX_14210 [Ditylenchus destructor]|uniref:Uncharacterized protein n=1 Tax=Ditylenchus destructor TaxID=166010 RepID=A0AAD4MT36_9BILA|nr:hypothetical protein DdX_14210 [Ditylenchus destructor]
MTKSGGYRIIKLDQEAVQDRGRVSGKHIREVMVETDRYDPFTTVELKFDINKIKYVNEKIKTLTAVPDSDAEDITIKGLNIYM